MEQILEKWTGRVGEVVIGATKENGGTRSHTVKVGGAKTLPFLHFEGEIPNPPVVAMEVWDMEPAGWPDVLKAQFSGVLDNPVAWAKKCVQDYKAPLLCLRLSATHPDNKNASADEAAKTVRAILEAVPVPLIITGSGHGEKDKEVIPVCAEAAKGENCLVGIAVQENYRTITASCQSGGHSIIAESPIDINLAKQLNILITDTGFPAEKIVMHHATGALGYGLEYTYSIIERSCQAALQGDRMMSMPIINFIGQEIWRTKEAKTQEAEMPAWGAVEKRGMLWETVTAMAYLQAGSNILVMNHPLAVKSVEEAINSLMMGRVEP